MSWSVKITTNKYLGIRYFFWILSCVILAILTFAGCETISPHGASRSGTGQREVFGLEHIDAERCIAFLSKVGIEKVSPAQEANGVSVSGSPGQLRRAGAALELVDAKEDFVIESLGPASMTRALPSNSQIAAALGGITIGTFANPPAKNELARGIIDVQGDSVLAILPARHWEHLFGPAGAKRH